MNQRLISVNELKTLREILKTNSENDHLLVIIDAWLTILKIDNYDFFGRDYDWLTLTSDNEIIWFLDHHPEIPRDKEIKGFIFGTVDDEVFQKEKYRYYRGLKKRLEQMRKEKK